MLGVLGAAAHHAHRAEISVGYPELDAIMETLQPTLTAAKNNTLGRSMEIFCGPADSLTEGMSAVLTDMTRQRWVGQLQQRLDAKLGRPMGRGMIHGATYSYQQGKFIVDTGETYDATAPWWRSQSPPNPTPQLFLGFGSTTMLTQTNGATASFAFEGSVV